jgi:hypothetical protein
MTLDIVWVKTNMYHKKEGKAIPVTGHEGP